MTAQPASPVDPDPEPQAPASGGTPPRPASGEAPPRRSRLGDPPRATLLIGVAASVLMLVGGFGAGGVLVRDPLLTNSPLGFWRYGHGHEMATAMVYLGVLLLIWAWIRLGRDVVARRAGGRAVLTCAAAWIVPMLFTPPLFTRDVFSYLAQGALPLAGLDPYAVGPEALPGTVTDNVHPLWLDTPAPYGPLFILLAKAVAAVAGDNVILGVVLMRVALLPGLAMFVWALPELTRRLGGRIPVALWIAVANPVVVVHLVGGIHNELLLMGLLATGAVLVLRGRHAGGIAVATAAVAVKASAGLALPFLVLVWAGRLSGPWLSRVARATGGGLVVFVAVFGVITLVAGVGLGWVSSVGAAGAIVHWYSASTALGLLGHAVVGLLVTDLALEPFLVVTRALGMLALLVVAVHQWWQARHGGPDAVRRAGIVLLAGAVLGPTLLSWYPSWGFALLAAAAWTTSRLGAVAFGSVLLMFLSYPDGDTAHRDLVLLGLAAVVALFAARALCRAPRNPPARSAAASVAR
ncbi:polyprenol phosphomannose-dependent alpha 1,6 mannosyltransferase MptB [Pseudonocardia sp.]|uniref:polyprenol phosphomannose-dependent alpha 1,6 mannosyltransferase MptB n=1 Tax=Pseudonocardia sp. TaxID=60912 RepID=UPI00260E1FDE|nr:polyprenol phosphomannose-dependent alpha 1,6 mannosyltransferase MptB [Pseudonocardia sp.]